MGNIICYCETGVMSQCKAKDVNDQISCEFFSKSARSSKCMHRNEHLDNHCWSYEAQEFGVEFGVVRKEDVETDTEHELDIDLAKCVDEVNSRHTCNTCLEFACPDLIKMQQAAQDRGGLSSQDLWSIGSGCPNYIDGAMLKQGGAP